MAVEANRELRGFVRWRIARLLRRHHDESGVIVVGQYPRLMSAYGRHAFRTLDVRIVWHKTETYLNWRLRYRTRTRVVQSKDLRRLVAWGYVGSSRPTFLAIEPNHDYTVCCTPSERDLSLRAFDISLRPGEKRLVYFDAMTRGQPSTIHFRSF